MTQKVIRIGGCRRSATTLTQRLLEQNFTEQTCYTRSYPPHKHGVIIAPDHESPNNPHDGYIFSVKNPWAYIASIRKWLQLDRLDTPDEWGAALDLFILGNWAAKNTTYLDFMDRHADKTLMVRSEDWVQHPGQVLRHIQEFFDLEWRDPGKWKRIDNHPSPRPGDTPESYDATYYTDARYMDEFTDERVDVIRDRLDDGWVARPVDRLGYSRDPPGWDW